MDRRVDYLESELIKYAESFAELSHHFSLLHNFLLHKFGGKFTKFIEVEDAGGEHSDAEVENNHDQQIKQEHEGEEDNGYSYPYEEDEEMGEEEEGVESQGQNPYQEEEDDEEGQGLDEEEEEPQPPPPPVSCPSQMVAVQFECDEEEDDSSTSTSQQKQQQLRKTQSNQPQRILSTLSQIKGGTVQKGVIGSTSVTRRVTRPPPPLIRRPPGPVTVAAQRIPNATSPANANTIRTAAVRRPESAVQVQVSRVVSAGVARARNSNGPSEGAGTSAGGSGTGKYARYYKKVDSELIQCKICNKILKRRGKFIQHLRTHTGEKPFCCEFCGASFSRRDNMNVHMTRHHSGTNPRAPINCQLCGSNFPNQEGFNAHLQLVHGYVTTEELDDDPNDMQDQDEDDGQQFYFEGDEDEQELQEDDDGTD